MNNAQFTGFFAYPSKPEHISETIRTAVEEINKSGQVQIKTWQQMKVSGKQIMHEICKEIDNAQLFCADLTGINPNVMFEIGYAIGTNKRIWQVLDTSLSSIDDWKQMQILTTTGYTSYLNSSDLVKGFYQEDPFSDLENTIFNEVIQPSLQPITVQKILYMKTIYNTESSKRISKRVSDSPIPTTVDDPNESAVNTLTWYGSQIYSSACIICHLVNPERTGAQLHNARYALVAGMAFGMNKPLLMLSEGKYLAPMDYRDLLHHYTTPSEAFRHVDEWLRHREREWRQIQTDRKYHQTTTKLATELKGLYIGEYIAENEADSLTDYFVETTSYNEALHGMSSIFVGRKGSGKSANLIAIKTNLLKDTNNLVCVIKPETYEVQSIAKLLSLYKEIDLKGYAIQSLWKFLIMSEIANATENDIESNLSLLQGNYGDRLRDLLDRNEGMIREEFSVRLERCVSQLLNLQTTQNTTSLEGSRVAISESLHDSLLTEIRNVLGNLLFSKGHVAVLIDNLDKAWDKLADLDNLAEFLLGLLEVAEKITREFRSEHPRYKNIKLSITVFLRSDIFYQILATAKEPDKIPYSRIRWRDEELLLRIINERFVSSHAGNVSPGEIWHQYFCTSVHGIPTKEYMLSRILPRPRDLVYFTKEAINLAVNRRHTIVEEKDILDAELRYSQFALDSILIDNGITIPELQSVIYQFIGGTSDLTRSELENVLSEAGIQRAAYDDIIRHLCLLSFLGIEVGNNEFRFVEDEDPSELQKNIILARRLQESRGIVPRYKVNTPFWSFLEIRVGGTQLLSRRKRINKDIKQAHPQLDI